MGAAASKVLSSGASSAGRSAGTGVATTVAPLVVMGTRSAGSSLGQTIGSGITSGLGAAVGSGVAGGLSPSPGGGPAQPQQPLAEPQQPLSDTPTVREVEVLGARPSAPPTSSLLTALGGASTSLAPALAAGLSAGASSLSSPTMAAMSPPSLANIAPTNVQELVVTPTQTAQPAIVGRDMLAPLPGAVAGLTDGRYDMEMIQRDLEEAQGPAEDNDITGKEAGVLGLLSLLGLKPADVLSLGLLGGALNQGVRALDSGPGGPGGPGGDPATNLGATAASNQQLSNMVQGRALTGLDGQIGGQGTNAIRRMVRNAQAAIRQRYSGMGMSGSTAEVGDLNAAAQAGVDMQFKLGQDIAQTGLQTVAALTGQNANIYTALLNAQTQRDTALGNALANFAGAAAGRLMKA